MAIVIKVLSFSSILPRPVDDGDSHPLIIELNCALNRFQREDTPYIFLPTYMDFLRNKRHNLDLFKSSESVYVNELGAFKLLSRFRQALHNSLPVDFNNN